MNRIHEQLSIEAHGTEGAVASLRSLQKSQKVANVLLRIDREDLVREIQVKRLEAQRGAARKRRQSVDGVPIVNIRVPERLDECLTDFEPRLLLVFVLWVEVPAWFVLMFVNDVLARRAAPHTAKVLRAKFHPAGEGVLRFLLPEGIPLKRHRRPLIEREAFNYFFPLEFGRRNEFLVGRAVVGGNGLLKLDFHFGRPGWASYQPVEESLFGELACSGKLAMSD